MGWGSGSVLMDAVIRKMKERNVTEETRKIVYEILIPAMQDRDWDTEMDCMGDDSAYDATLRALHPEELFCSRSHRDASTAAVKHLRDSVSMKGLRQ